MFIKSSFPATIFLLLFLFVGRCSGEVIKISGSEPDLIKQYKSIIVYASKPGIHDTGIKVHKGDFISVMAKGNIQYSPGFSSGPERHLVIRLGKKNLARRYFPPNNSFFAHETGTIYLGYGYTRASNTDPYGESGNLRAFSKAQGQYEADIIVWQKEDPVPIADFLEKVRLSDPDNKALETLALDFKGRKEIVLAERKAKKEVEEAQKAILALKGEKGSEVKEVQKEKPVSGTNEKKLQEDAKQAIEDVKKKEALGIKDAQKEKQMDELTDKLQNALQSLKDLEEMKKKLAEQQEKEKQLVTRLEQVEEEKLKLSLIPPVIAIGTPKDGASVDSEYVNLFGVVEHDKGIEKFEILVNQQLVGKKDPQET